MYSPNFTARQADCCCPPLEVCTCGSPFGFTRRFATNTERKERLEEYISLLEKELEGARERLKDLK